MDVLYAAKQGLTSAFLLDDTLENEFANTLKSEPDHALDHELAFERAAADLQDVIHVIAERYLLRGVPLTWRLLHAIEAEALADLGLASRHAPKLIALFVHRSASRYPYTDETVSVTTEHAVPLLTWFVLDVYGIPAIAAPKAAPRGVAHAVYAVNRAHAQQS